MIHKRSLMYALLWIPFWGAAQSAPDLKELIEAAMARDGLLQQQSLEIQYTDLDQKKLKDVFLPKLEITGRGGFMHTGIHLTTPEVSIPKIPMIFPGLSIPEGSNTLNISGFSGAAKAEASMLIYSGGKVKHLKKALDEKNLSQQELLQNNRNEIITTISKAYDQFALVHQSKKVLDESKKRLDANKKTADKALGYGLITPYDHKKIELAQATLDSKLAEYEGKRELLITQLEVLTGIGRERIAQIDPQLNVIEYNSENQSVENRAEIKALEHGIKATEHKIQAENTWWIPKVQAITSLSYFGLYGDHIYTSKEIIPNTGKKLDLHPNSLNAFPIFQAGIGFKWNPFDGNQGKREIEKNKIEKQILESKKTDAIRKLELNLANNQTNYSISFSQIALKNKQKQIAANALRQADKEFRYGTIKFTQFLEAQNDLENAELEYQTAIFNQRRAAIELMKATQNLTVDAL